jgi:hypothetical protein
MENAKVYLLNRNQLERSPLMTAPTTASRPKLLDQVREAIRTRHYSPKTEESSSTGSNDSFSFTIDAIRSR